MGGRWSEAGGSLREDARTLKRDRRVWKLCRVAPWRTTEVKLNELHLRDNELLL